MSKDRKLVYTTDPAEAKRLRDQGKMPEVRDRPAAEQTIRIAIDRKRRRGKSVTVASGFELTPDSLKELAKKLKSKVGAGGTASGSEIEVQGEHVDVVRETLASLGYRVK